MLCIQTRPQADRDVYANCVAGRESCPLRSLLPPTFCKRAWTKPTVYRLCQHLKKITKMNDMFDRVQAEWLMYIFDLSLDTLQIEYENSGDIHQYMTTTSETFIPDVVVRCWMRGKKYVNLAHAVKAALTLSHSSAIPERGFSLNNALLGKDSLPLSEKTIVGERTLFGSLDQ